MDSPKILHLYFKTSYSLTRSFLLTLAFGKPFTDTKNFAFHNDITYKKSTILTQFLVHYPEFYILVHLLRPLYQTTLIVLVRPYHHLYIVETLKDLIEQKPTTLLVSLININSSYQSFESIAIDITIMLTSNTTSLYKLVQTDFQCQFVKPLTTNQITA